MGNGGVTEDRVRMVQLFAFRRSLRLIALALCSMAIAISATPASARSHHGAGRHARAHHIRHYAQHHYRHYYRHVARASHWDRGVAQMQARGLADANASTSTSINASAAPSVGSFTGFGSSSLVSEARRYLGGNPTGRGSLWCARFMNLVLQHSGYHGTGSDMASSFAKYGQRGSGPQGGGIAGMGRRGGGHVGILTGVACFRKSIIDSRHYSDPVPG